MNPNLAQFFLRPPSSPSPPPPPATGHTVPPWIALFGPRTLPLPRRTVPPWMVLFTLPRFAPAASLFGAINAYWSLQGLTSTANTLTSAGPLSAELAKPGTSQPFARMTTVAMKPFWNFTKNYWEWQWVQFAVYGSGEADARVRGEAVREAMDAVMSNPSLLSMSPGTVAGCWREEGVQVSKCVGTNIPADATYQAILKYRFQINRTRP